MKKFLSVIIALTIVLAMMPVGVFALSDISGATIDTIASETYTASEITPTPTVTLNGNTLVEGVDFTYEYSNNIDVGTATVTVVGMGNYSGTASKNFSIARATFSVGISIADWREGETPNQPVITGIPESLMSVAVVEYRADSDGSSYSTEVPTTAGNYLVKVNLARTSNYNRCGASAKFTIGAPKLAQTITADNVTATYGDTNTAVSATTTGNGTISYAVTEGTDVVDVNATTGALTIKKAGTATVTVTAAVTDTYKAATKDVTVTVNPVVVAVPEADTTEFTYDGTAKTYTIATNDAYTVNGNVQTDANETGYNVTVALNDETNYKWDDDTTAPKTYNFVINKAVVTAPVADTAEFTYTGTAQTYTIAPNDAYTVEGNIQINANETGHTVTVTLNDEANYKWDDGTTAPKTYEFIIDKATIVITAKDKNTTTGNVAPTLGEGDYTVEGLVNGETLKTNPTLSYESTPNMTDGGKFNITVSGAEAPDGDNYNIEYNNATLTVTKSAQGGGMLLVLLLRANEAEAPTEPEVPVEPETPAEPDAPAEPGASEDCTKDEACPLYNFIDLDLNAWYHDGVHFCVTEGLMLGTDETTFDPMLTVNRATLVTVLWRLAGSPAVDTAADFTDVEADMWYTDAIAWASANGIVNGYGEGKFGTTDKITREQTVAILNRYAIVKALANSEDAEASLDYTYSDWAKNNVAWAVENGLLENLGIDVTDLTAEASRTELATYIYRFVKNIVK